MALTKISRSLLNTGISDSSDATAITIDSGELVGIGQTPVTSDGAVLQITGNDGIQLKRSGQTNGFLLRPGASTDGLRFSQANVGDRMVIDGEGNIAIGGGAASNFSGYVTVDLRDSTGGLLDFSEASSGVYARVQGINNNSFQLTNLQNYPLILNTNNTERMRILGGGDILIGDTARRGTNWRGQIQVTQIDSTNAAGISCITGNDEISGTFALYSSSTASAAISVDPDAARASSALYFLIDNVQKASLDASGNFAITGSYSSSDRTLKENIVTLPSQLETVKKLNPVSFDWKEKAEDGSTKSSIGFIAQEIETLYPDLVNTPVADPDMSNTTTKSLNYAVMTAILTKAIQEQQTIIDDLKSRIETLEG